MSKPIVSIVMPAFNVEKYIEETVESVLKQTFQNWELIIIDDHSGDSTWEILKKYDDPRIIKFQRKSNSGSAYIPRAEGVNVANGKWIINLDADDYIDNSYIEKLLNKALRTGVEICCPQMIGVDEQGGVLDFKIPVDDFDFEEVYQNREAFNCTVPRWEIGMNGALIKQSLWKKALCLYGKKEKYGIHDDENLSRILLLEAERIAVCKASYYFRSNPTSITKRFTLKTFEWMYTNIDLRNIVVQRFGESSQEYKNVIFYDFLCYMVVVIEFVKNLNDERVFLKGYSLLKQWHSSIKWDVLNNEFTDIKQRIFMYFNISLLSVFFRYPNMTCFKIVYKCLVSKIIKKIKNNDFYAWHLTRRKREKKIKKQLSEYYVKKDSHKKYDNSVICIYDGMIQAGGLADRLKGILCAYSIAKNKKIPFRLYFYSPFPLQEFWAPNSYNWTIEKEEICMEINKVNVVVLDNTKDSRYQKKKQKEYLRKKIKQNNKQKHVYTNASFSYDLDYAELYKELFRPTERLQKSIDNQKQLIGSKYISVSCRFLDLLGDFNETYGYGEAMPNNEKQILLDRIDSVILKLHKKFPDMKILINSDSATFLRKYEGGKFTYVIPGYITHIDAKQGSYLYEQYEKTFLDFMMIADAERVYLLKSSLMHKSGYPYAASRIHGKPFEIIEI